MIVYNFTHQFYASVFYCTLLNKEFYLDHFFFFCQQVFWSVLPTLSMWSSKMFFFYPLSINFCFGIAQCFLYSVSVEHMVLILNTWLYGMFLKWLRMVWMCMEIGLLISGFSVESCLKSVVLVFIYNCIQKWYIVV